MCEPGGDLRTGERAQDLGYLERKPDVTERRAKLIVPTARGRQALRGARDRVAEIEQHWSGLVGPDRFATTCRTLLDFLDTLNDIQAPKLA